MTDLERVIYEAKKAIIGKDTVLWWVMTALLAGGHILLEDIPGVGKTTMALAFSKALGLEYGRVQFTPDVMPSDVTGYNVFNTQSGQMQFRKGAVMCNLFLADELNRATSRTQSALLQAMEEGAVTVDGKTYKLARPFIVIATQNPTGAAGTTLLPDSQLDRFTVRLSIGYPSPKSEGKMILTRQSGLDTSSIEQVMSRETLIAHQDSVSRVFIKQEVADYIVALVTATRSDQRIVRGASPRASLSVAQMSRARAYVMGRDYVIPEDVKAVFPETVAHRILLRREGQGADRTAAQQVIADIVGSVRAPAMRPQ